MGLAAPSCPTIKLSRVPTETSDLKALLLEDITESTPNFKTFFAFEDVHKPEISLSPCFSRPQLSAIMQVRPEDMTMDRIAPKKTGSFPHSIS
jgi:hypothetical protein